MTPEEKERVDWLCKQIQVEKDQEKFNALVSELNEILSQKNLRLGDLSKSATQS